MRILIAEDDPDIAGLVSHYLQKAGWETRVEASGDRALAYARAHPVDLIILDVMLPGMTGFDVCRALRAEPASARYCSCLYDMSTEIAKRFDEFPYAHREVIDSDMGMAGIQ